MPTNERIEGVNWLYRAALEAERQNPDGVSNIAWMLRLLARLASSGQVSGDDWDAIFAAAFHGPERVVAKLPPVRAQPVVRTAQVRALPRTRRVLSDESA